MIAVDLDGTLLNSQKRISDRDREALQAAVARGVEIVPVTGRNYAFALPVIQTLPFAVPLISSNGAVIRSRQGETLFRRLLPVETATKILQATREFRPYTVVMYDQMGPGLLRIEAVPNGTSIPAGIPAGDSPYSNGVAGSLWVQRNPSLVRFVISLEEDLEADPLEVMFAGPATVIRELAARLESGLPVSPLTGSAPAAEPAAKEFRSLLTEYLEPDFSILDVIGGECSKGHALEYWSREHGIAPAEIMAVGDNFNDLEMLRFAGLPVVMGNADELLKQEGWAVTLDCDSGGVAQAIQRYVL